MISFVIPAHEEAALLGGLLEAAHLRLLLRFACRGRGLLRSREALDLWYGPRR